jgi:hypothetical protein
MLTSDVSARRKYHTTASWCRGDFVRYVYPYLSVLVLAHPVGFRAHIKSRVVLSLKVQVAL